MGDNNLLESYNPLYDVHLRQYFASPHMQKHLRNLGLLDSNGVPVQGTNNVEGQLYARHQVMMDMMLRNKERVLMQLADLQKKLDAAEKVEIYRRIRSGITNAEEFRRHHLTTRSFSRPARARSRPPENDRVERQRRHSGSFDDSDLLKRIENDYEEAQKVYEHDSGKGLYGRLAANAYKYQYLHKLDDRTLLNYKDMLQRQLQKLERFREISFGPHSVAKHQPPLQTSWFFRRRNSKSGTRARTGKSLSPSRASGLPATSTSAQPITRRAPLPRQPKKLPPLPKKKTGTPTAKANGHAQTGQKLPPTAIIRPSKKEPESNRSSSGASVEKTEKLPSISPTPLAAAGAAAAAVGAAALAAISPQASDGEYSRPETEASGHLSVGNESDATSPQPQSDIEPEHEAEIEAEPSTPQVERKFEMEPEVHEEDHQQLEHVQEPVAEPEHDAESVHSEKTHDASSQPPTHREEVVSVTSSRLESARELLERVRGIDSPSQSPKPDDRGASQMSRDSIDGHVDHSQGHEKTHEEVHDQVHEPEITQQHVQQLAEEPQDDLISASESFKQVEDQVQHELEDAHERVRRSVGEVPEENEMETSVYHQQEESQEPHFQDEYQPTEHHEDAHDQQEYEDHHVPLKEEDHEESHKVEEAPPTESLQRHRDSFTESESEPNLHYQTQSFAVESNEATSAIAPEETQAAPTSADSFHDSSVPTIEGESLRDSEEETRPNTEAHEQEVHDATSDVAHHVEEYDMDKVDVERKPSYEAMVIHRDSVAQDQNVHEEPVHQDYQREDHDDIEETFEKVDHQPLEGSAISHPASQGGDHEPVHEPAHDIPASPVQPEDHFEHPEPAHDQGPSTPDSPEPHEHEDQIVDNAGEETFERKHSHPLTGRTDDELHEQSHVDHEESHGISHEDSQSSHGQPEDYRHEEEHHEDDEVAHGLVHEARFDQPEEEPYEAQKSSTLLSQPSIEITPASEYGGSVEHLDRSARTPISPVSQSESIKEEPAAEITNHETTYRGEYAQSYEPEGPEEVDQTAAEQYRLPESPDPNAHNDIIPEQCAEHGEIVVPADGEISPRDHIPEYHPQTHEYEAGHEHDFDSPREEPHHEVYEGHNDLQGHDEHSAGHHETHEEIREASHEPVDHSSNEDVHNALSHEYDQIPHETEVHNEPEVTHQEYDDDQGHHIVHSEHHVDDNEPGVHIETESLHITTEQNDAISPRSEVSHGSESGQGSELPSGRTEDISPDQPAVHEDILASPRTEAPELSPRHEDEDHHISHEVDISSNEPQVYDDEYTDEQGHHTIHEEHRVHETEPGVHVEEYSYQQTTDNDADHVTNRSEYSEQSVTHEPNLMEQSVYEDHSDGHGHDHEVDYDRQSQVSQEVIHHEPEHHIVSEDYTIDQQHHEHLPEAVVEQLNLSHEQNVHEDSYTDDSQPGHHVEEHHYTITSDAEPNKNVEVEDYSEQIDGPNGVHVEKHFQSTTTIVNENGNYSNGHKDVEEDDNANEKTSLLSRSHDSDDDGDTDSVIIRSSPETTDRTGPETGRAEI
uniref:Serine-rich adhesin for platelets n=1 Tax=Bursaphelenchus xylophilus TaxID=6326 RepID=A0A1I7RKG3_BURXY